MHVRPLSVLDDDSRTLLWLRAHEHARDAEHSMEHFQAALEAGKINAVCLYNEADEPRGLSAWRWQDDAHSYAQVIMLYTPQDSPPELGAALVDHVFSACSAGGLEVLEVRMRDDSPGVRDAWMRHNLVVFERCRMTLRLGHLPLPLIPTPDHFRVEPWTDAHQHQVDQLIAAAHAHSVDSVAVPDTPTSIIVETLRRLRMGDLPGAGNWNPAASLVVLDRYHQVAGCIAVTELQMDGTAVVKEIAVHPVYQRQGLARLLTVRSMAACLKQGLVSVSLAVTTRNPGRTLCNQLGFQATHCGEVAIWWHDGRQLVWR